MLFQLPEPPVKIKMPLGRAALPLQLVWQLGGKGTEIGFRGSLMFDRRK